MFLFALISVFAGQVDAAPERNAAQQDNGHLLHAAIEQGNAAEVRRLLKLYPALKNAPDQQKRTPLALSLIHNREEIFAIISDAKPDANLALEAAHFPLAVAARMGNHSAVARLLRHNGADVHGPEGTDLAIVQAAKVCDYTAVELLVTHGANVDAIDAETGQSVLGLALDRHCESMVELLIKVGAPIDKADANGQTFLDLISLGIASESQRRWRDRIRTEAIQRLDRRKRINLRRNATDIHSLALSKVDPRKYPLHAAIQNRDYQKMAKALYARPKLVNVPDNHKRTPYVIAILNDDSRAIHLLRRGWGGSDALRFFDDALDPLVLAVTMENHEEFRALMHQCRLVGCKASLDRALASAAQICEKDMLTALLNAGANANAVAPRIGMSALRSSVANRCAEGTVILLRANARLGAEEERAIMGADRDFLTDLTRQEKMRKEREIQDRYDRDTSDSALHWPENGRFVWGFHLSNLQGVSWVLRGLWGVGRIHQKESGLSVALEPGIFSGRAAMGVLVSPGGSGLLSVEASYLHFWTPAKAPWLATSNTDDYFGLQIGYSWYFIASRLGIYFPMHDPGNTLLNISVGLGFY